MGVRCCVVESHGTEVYRALSCLGLRSEPQVCEESKWKSDAAVDAGALVAVDCVQPSRIGSNNGVPPSFLHRLNILSEMGTLES